MSAYAAVRVGAYSALASLFTCGPTQVIEERQTPLKVDGQTYGTPVYRARFRTLFCIQTRHRSRGRQGALALSRTPRCPESTRAGQSRSRCNRDDIVAKAAIRDELCAAPGPHNGPQTKH